MLAWWNSLNIALQVFYCIAVPATVVLLIQTLLMLIGIGDDADGIGGFGDGDADGISDIDGVFGDNDVADVPDGFGFDSLRIFTLRGFVAFFVVFGWVGVLMQTADVSLWLTVIVSTVCGAAIMLLLAILLRAVMRLRSDGNADNRNAIGISGKVYLTIPPSRTGEGKVQLMLQGSYVERNAVTDDTEAIATGCEVVVVGLSGQTDLVVKKK